MSKGFFKTIKVNLPITNLDKIKMSIERLSKYLKQQGYKLSLSLGEFNLSKTSLGQGGNALVYEASFLQKVVAIKFLITESTGNTRSQKLKRFLAEYFNIISIHDPSNIVRYIDYDLLKFTDDEGDLEIPVIIMKKYDESLAKEREKGIDREGFLSLYNFLVNTVEKIHNSGIIHRDIKPENILIDGDNFVLADFGIASFNPEMFTVKALTGKKERLGNRLFSAPEQEDSGIEPHKTMDIYAIGQVLHWYVTGRPHRGTGRQNISNIIDDLEIYNSLIDICLYNDPLKRFQSIKEIRGFLKKTTKKNVWEYLRLFNLICRRNFPKNETGIFHSSEIRRIDQLFADFHKEAARFEDYLWWHNGISNSDFIPVYVDEGVWLFGDIEYNIKEIWVHYDSRVYNDFILVHYLPSKPFIVDGEELFYSVIVDDQFHISSTEYQNGYAEINGEIVNLFEHKVESIQKENEEGYLFIGTKFNCILRTKNDLTVMNFIKNVEETGQIDFEEFKLFIWSLRKHIYPDVVNSL